MRDFSKDPFSLFFSGVQGDRYFDIVTKESLTVLMSYLYFKSKPKKFLKERVDRFPDLKMMIDSGAHTFIQEPEYADKDVAYWESYLKGYIAWIRENREVVFAAVELDIDYLVGQEKVDEWREKYFKPLEEEGIQIIYVWHKIRGEKDWESMCKKFKYVGFSVMGDKDLTTEKGNKMVNIARKYGARTHGFAVTSFDFMSKVPFYTVDSTTWLIGTQYGELNFFDGRKMKRLKKAVWKRQYKNKLIELGADWNLAEREEPYELIRINILTFIKVEEYIRKIMMNKMYWIKKEHFNGGSADMPKREVVDFSEVKLPEDTWFNGEMEDWEDYCVPLGIDVKLGKEQATTLLTHYSVFINEKTETIEKYTDEEIFYFVDLFKMRKLFNTAKKAKEEFSRIFKENACGVRHDFENLAQVIASADDRVRPKEREDYIEEPSVVTVDITKKEIDALLSQFIPEDSSMPEVDAYDEILRKNNIIAVRDSKGRFLKGQKLVRKPKSIYSDKMYKLSCDTCIKSATCPEYREGYVCAFNKMFKRFNTRDANDIQDAIHSIVEENGERLERAMMFELMDGGVLDPMVNTLMSTQITYMNMLQQMNNVSPKMVAEQRIVVDANGNSETVTTVSSNTPQGGILNQLFSGMGDKKRKEEKPIDAEFEEKKEEDD